MQKKILLAVDDSTPSRQAVDYAGRMNGLIQGLTVTLFHIQPPISQFLLDEAKRSGRAQAELNKITARNAEASRGLLAGYRETLIRAGLAEPAVELATQPRNQGLAKDILDYAQNGLFDAILEDADVRTQKARVVMGPSLPVIAADTTLEEIANKLGNGSPAVLVQMPNGLGILTKQDIIGKLK